MLNEALFHPGQLLRGRSPSLLSSRWHIAGATLDKGKHGTMPSNVKRDLPSDIHAFFAYKRRGLRTAVGFSRDESGSNLPTGYGRWQRSRKRDRWALDIAKVITDVHTQGYSVQPRGTFRMKEGFAAPLPPKR
jgi:hypothetical protein